MNWGRARKNLKKSRGSQDMSCQDDSFCQPFQFCDMAQGIWIERDPCSTDQECPSDQYCDAALMYCNLRDYQPHGTNCQDGASCQLFQFCDVAQGICIERYSCSSDQECPIDQYCDAALMYCNPRDYQPQGIRCQENALCRTYQFCDLAWIVLADRKLIVMSL